MQVLSASTSAAGSSSSGNPYPVAAHNANPFLRWNPIPPGYHSNITKCPAGRAPIHGPSREHQSEACHTRVVRTSAYSHSSPRMFSTPTSTGTPWCMPCCQLGQSGPPHRLLQCQAASRHRNPDGVGTVGAIGLYGIPSLSSPQGFSAFGTKAELKGLTLLAQLESGKDHDLELLLQDFEQSLGELLAPTSHCREHHTSPVWRDAASATEEHIRRLRSFVFMQLKNSPEWAAWQQKEQRKQQQGGTEGHQDQSASAAEPAAATGAPGVESGSVEGGGADGKVPELLHQLLQSTVNFEGSASPQDMAEAEQLNQLQDICESVFDDIYGGDPSLLPTLVLHASQIDGDAALQRMVRPMVLDGSAAMSASSLKKQLSPPISELFPLEINLGLVVKLISRHPSV
eukprot:gene28770-31952_t